MLVISYWMLDFQASETRAQRCQTNEQPISDVLYGRRHYYHHRRPFHVVSPKILHRHRKAFLLQLVGIQELAEQGPGQASGQPGATVGPLVVLEQAQGVQVVGAEGKRLSTQELQEVLAVLVVLTRPQA